jgi:Asp-tRNA(Asn)/Glu-tRNA(Gln) amidotransferase A subunit family amidase
MWQKEITGLLVDTRLAVKDLFAVQGYKNSAGNPDWYRTHSEADQTAIALDKLMNEGSTFVGFTHTDELAYSLEGNNDHFGASDNPKKRGYACGGSSMGSAAAVASQWADIGLGTDTGGSIRVPASYCGLFGMRPSHGVISTEGLIGLAPSFDTVGWFARDAQLLSTVGDILLPLNQTEIIETLVVCPDVFELVDASLRPSIESTIERIRPFFKRVVYQRLTGTKFNDLNEVFRVLQGREIAENHREWIESTHPSFTPTVQSRLDMAFAISRDEQRAAKKVQKEFVAHLKNILPTNAVLFLPTTPSVAPEIGEDVSSLRSRLLQLTAFAGLSGSPQVHLPLTPLPQGKRASFPYGFSLLSHRNSDLALLSCVKELTDYWNSEVI